MIEKKNRKRLIQKISPRKKLMIEKETDLKLHLLFIFLTICSISFQKFISQILSHFITLEYFFLSSTFLVPHSLTSSSLSKSLPSRPFETVLPFSHHSVSLQLCYCSYSFLLLTQRLVFHLTGNLHQLLRDLILLVMFLSTSFIISFTSLLSRALFLYYYLSLSIIISPCLTAREFLFIPHLLQAEMRIQED